MSVIIPNNQGGQRLDPEVFREVMKKRVLEQKARGTDTAETGGTG